MYNRFKITQKQKSIIELQKDEAQKQKILIEEHPQRNNRQHKLRRAHTTQYVSY